MATEKPKSNSQSEQTKEGITRITVGGFKSIDQEQSIEIRPLTILAGVNSSGKSSIMQPLLLLKQTLEAPYDPGALLLDGPNVRFTSANQLLSRMKNGKVTRTFHVGIEVGTEATVTNYFTYSEDKGFEVEQTTYESDKIKHRLYTGMPQEEILSALSASFESNSRAFLGTISLKSDVVLTRNRCFLTLAIKFEDGSTFATPIHLEAIAGEYIRQIVHLPGLRGSPARTYPVTAVSSEFPGTFENYVASVIRQWQTDSNKDKLEKVNRDLTKLGLTGKVVARPIDDTQVELLVNRFLDNNEVGAEKMVSIADVGLGLSRTLSVVVALHAINHGQLLYVEEPDIYLHPRAQYTMAEVLALSLIHI